MSQVSLKEYAARIARQIEGGSIQEAIAHCRHILAHYPRYLPAYRLLAQACLENGDLAHATHFFQCVLSADPEDANAWMNLAMLSDDLGELEQATWLMERAFEVEPGNARIRSLLGQLYSRRDGVERTRIKLTSSALARLYAAGGFYRQAVEELQKLLGEPSGLLPLHIAQLEVALAKALWHTDGMTPLADKISQSLVEKLPNCLQANLIMGQVRWSAGLEEEAEPYLDIVRGLDPEGWSAYAMFGEQSPVPTVEVEIPYLEYQTEVPAPEQVAAPEVEDTSWLDQVGTLAEGGPALSPAAEGQAETPEWLRDWSVGDQTAVSDLELTAQGEPQPQEHVVSPESEGVPTAEEALVEAPAEEEELPDWLRQMSAGVEGEQADLTIEEAPAEALVEEEELPDWLRQMSAGVEGEQADIAIEEVPAEALAEEEIPDWLQELGTEAEAAPTVTEEAPAEALVEEEELPDWLRQMSAEVEGEQADLTIGEAPAEALAEEEIPDWLQELGTEAEAAPTVTEEAPAEALVEEEELPDWLRQMSAEVEGEQGGIAIEEAPAEALAEEEVPGWLQDLGAEIEAERADITAKEASAEALAEEELLEPEAKVEGEEPGIMAEETRLELAAEEEIPDWLQELGTTVESEESIVAQEDRELAEPVDEQEIPDWLRELRPPDMIGEPGPVSDEADLAALLETSVEPTSEQDLPDWLVELQPQNAIDEPAFPAIEEEEPEALPDTLVEPAPEEEIPDWLQELRSTIEAPVSEPGYPVEQEEPLATAELQEMPPPVEGMPDWLIELETEIGGRAVSRPAAEEAPAEEPELAVEPETLEGTTAAAVPGWLAELETEIGEQGSVALEEAAPAAEVEEAAAPEPVVPAAPVSERDLDQGVPEWLAELEVEAPESELFALDEVQSGVSEEDLKTGQAADAGFVEEAEPASFQIEPGERPEWLARLEDEQAAELTVDEMPQWLDQLHAVDVEGLTEEEMAPPVSEAETGGEELAWLREIEEMGTPESAEILEETAPQAQAHVIGEPEPAVQEQAPRPLPVADDAEARLALARAYLQQGELDVSAAEFEELVKIPSLTERLIGDLEEAVGLYPEQPALHRILGDAYMRSGQLQKALNAYRDALARL